MIAVDFEYAGEYLNDWGFMICSIESIDNIKKSGSVLSFNSTSMMNGKLSELTTAKYEDHIEVTFQICKSIDISRKLNPVSVYEQRELTRWLNRPTFHKFKLIQPEWADIYLEGSFNVTNIEFSGEVYLLELKFISNTPFALHEPILFSFSTSEDNNRFSFFDRSDEIGFIYPDLNITCLKSGDLQIHNSNDDRTTVIRNCSANEVLSFSKELLFSSTLPSHKVQNDFNYVFLRIGNTYGNRKNILTFTIPVKVEMTYSAYVKVVV